MTDSEDFPADKTARDKYDMDDEASTRPISMIERARKAAARRANAKEYAFTCYMCWKHGTRFLKIKEQGYDGPEQFVITCWKCKAHPKKKYASLPQIEKFARAYPNIDISSFETRSRPQVKYRKPVVQNEASRFYFEKMFGKD